MSLNISDTTVHFKINCWCLAPGQWFLLSTEDRNTAQRIFSTFTKKTIPQAKFLIDKLIQKRQILEIHLPLTVFSIFLLYLDEHIEHYQSQLDERDAEIDQKIQELKCTFATNRYQLWTTDPQWLFPFLDAFKNKLSITDTLPVDFEETISLWTQILRVAHLGDMHLISLYDNKAKSGLFFHENKASFVITEIPRPLIEESFSLVLREFSRNFKWVTTKIHAKLLQISGDVELAEELKILSCDISQVLELQPALKECLRSLSILDLKNSQKIEELLDRLRKIQEMLKLLRDVSHNLKMLKERQKGLEKTNLKELILQAIFFASSMSAERLEALGTALQSWQDCHVISDFYLSNYIFNFERLLEALQSSNKAWSDYKTTGSPPSLASKALPILPVSRQYDEKLMNELLSERPSKKQGQKAQAKNKSCSGSKRKGRKQNQSTSQTKPTSKKPSTDAPKAPKLAKIAVSEDSIFLGLKKSLIALHEEHPRPILRQAIWHLDSLICIQNSFSGKSPPKAEDSLIILNATISSAQKILEQIYRYSLTQEDHPTTSHNLKEYHRALYPTSTSYPPIVNQLYLANNWSRYFYKYQHLGLSLSTQNLSVPPLVNLLVSMAEGHSLPLQQLQKQVNEIIEPTCSLVKTLISDVKIPTTPPFSFVESPIQLQQPLDINAFDPVTNQLKTCLSKSGIAPNHPGFLRIKQALAAIKMLKASLQRINNTNSLSEIVTWTAWSLQQLQETVEEILHTIELFQNGEESVTHEVKKLSKQMGLEMGPLKESYHQLSYKTRYPVENLVDSFSAQIIDDIEALRQHPELMDGFKLVKPSKMVWKTPSDDKSLEATMLKLSQLISETRTFLLTNALPALLTSIVT